LNRAKKAGLYVIALDTALNPGDTADITFATDNFQAGKLIGEAAAVNLNGQEGRHRDARPVQQPGRVGRHPARPRFPHRHGHQPQ
jgi:ABC-type sugar transport system substrate-binding protein